MMSLLSDDPLEQSLLRAIYENYGDRDPVLIYADWLDEQATDETDLRSRLLRQHWSPEHPGADRETQASEPVNARQAWFSARERAHAMQTPLDTTGVLPLVVFRSIREWLNAADRTGFADDPYAVRFEFRREDDLAIEDGEIIRLILSSRAREARVLDLSFAGCNDVGAAHLASGPNFAKLRRLDLTGNNLGDEGALALARGHGLPSLRTLAAADNNIGPLGANALCKRKHHPHLETLDLRGNPLRTAGRDLCDALQREGVDVIYMT